MKNSFLCKDIVYIHFSRVQLTQAREDAKNSLQTLRIHLDDQTATT